jgi:GGDEF domain-containing protein
MLAQNPLGRKAEASVRGEPRVTVSVGLATVDETSMGSINRVEQLVNAADQALHAAKAAGGNCVRMHKPRQAAA